jgi:hypothetical protein
MTLLSIRLWLLHKYSSLSTEKNLIRKKRRKNVTSQHDEDQQQTKKGLIRLATWNVRSLYRPGGLRITINELRKYKIAIAAIQETRWKKLTPQACTSKWL